MKIRDITPASFACEGGGCPGIYETDRGTYLIIGSKADFAEDLLSDKIGPDETIIEIPAELIRQLTLSRGDEI